MLNRFVIIIGGIFLLVGLGGAFDSSSVSVQAVLGVAMLLFVYKLIWGSKPKRQRHSKPSFHTIDVYETTEVIRRKFIKKR